MKRTRNSDMEPFCESRMPLRSARTLISDSLRCCRMAMHGATAKDRPISVDDILKEAGDHDEYIDFVNEMITLERATA